LHTDSWWRGRHRLGHPSEDWYLPAPAQERRYPPLERCRPDAHHPSRHLEARRVPRIVTYNVHRCVGTDGRLSPKRIADVLAECEPDIVALQELDVMRARTGLVDQAHEIAFDLEMDLQFHPAFKVTEEAYGDAILTSYPLRLVKAGPLPGLKLLPKLEPRGALWVAIDVGGIELQVLNTHLGLLGRERMAQVEALLGPGWLGGSRAQGPLVLLGDFNMLSRSRAYRRLAARFTDAALTPGVARPGPTFPTRYPALRIDHVFVTPPVKVRRMEVPRTALSRLASDHLPLVMDFEIAPEAAARESAEPAAMDRFAR
jgi:endonuclease/exonuclease/phosphatase family metal-dependent hydrolase